MMLATLTVLGLISAGAGALLAWTDRRFPRNTDALVAAIDRTLPQTQCAQCGYPGCRPYAEAIAAGAPIDRCPPGGEGTVRALERLLRRAPAATPAPVDAPLAVIDETRCIGCALCLPACPVDAIIGAQTFVHTVLPDTCTGCALCLAPCPVDCIELVPRPRHAAARPVRILARPRNRLPDEPAQPCIRCGLCAPVCPANLLPQELFWHAAAGAIDSACDHGLDRCIECGLCNQVCPSNIDLLAVFTTARQARADAQALAVEADAARARFERRSERLALQAATRADRRAQRLRDAARPWQTPP
jgi:electron transport complex protein RnfB